MVARLYHYRFPHREGLILNYNDGWGEIAPLPSFSKETFSEAKEEILSCLPFLDSAQPTLASVQFGLSCAKTPFSLSPLKVPICAFQSPQRGNSHLKLKLGSLPLDEALSLTRKYYRKYRLRLDCNRKWSLQEALYFASHFSVDDFDYLEEPVQTLSELIRFSQITRFPVAVDESAQEAALCEIPTLKAVVVKPTLLGSIPHFPHPIVLSSSYESSLGHLLIAKRAASNTLPLGLGTCTLCCDEILEPPLRLSNGYLHWSPSKNPINLSKLCLIASVP